MSPQGDNHIHPWCFCTSANLSQSIKSDRQSCELHLCRHARVYIKADFFHALWRSSSHCSGRQLGFLALRSGSLLEIRAVFSAPGNDHGHGGRVPSMGVCERGAGVVCADWSGPNPVHCVGGWGWGLWASDFCGWSWLWSGRIPHGFGRSAAFSIDNWIVSNCLYCFRCMILAVSSISTENIGKDKSMINREDL